MQAQTISAEAVETRALGKRYGKFWALKECNIVVPKGSITALVGSNGAGKSTLLKLLTGLSVPTTGQSTVLSKSPAQTTSFLADVGYLAQEIPLYKQFTATDYLNMGAHMNSRWDGNLMRERLHELEIPFDKPVGKLSGGQRAQVALALALSKKPRLLLLDEPVAALDPLARRDFLSSLAQAVTDSDLTVIMSSHLLDDLEFICDHVILLATGHSQLCDSIDQILQTHRLLIGPFMQNAASDAYHIVQETHTNRQSNLLVRLANPKHFMTTNWQVNEVTIQEVVLAYMSQGTHVRQLLTGGSR